MRLLFLCLVLSFPAASLKAQAGPDKPRPRIELSFQARQNLSPAAAAVLA